MSLKSKAEALKDRSEKGIAYQDSMDPNCDPGSAFGSVRVLQDHLDEDIPLNALNEDFLETSHAPNSSQSFVGKIGLNEETPQGMDKEDTVITVGAPGEPQTTETNEPPLVERDWGNETGVGDQDGKVLVKEDTPTINTEEETSTSLNPAEGETQDEVSEKALPVEKPEENGYKDGEKITSEAGGGEIVNEEVPKKESSVDGDISASLNLAESGTQDEVSEKEKALSIDKAEGKGYKNGENTVSEAEGGEISNEELPEKESTVDRDIHFESAQLNEDSAVSTLKNDLTNPQDDANGAASPVENSSTEKSKTAILFTEDADLQEEKTSPDAQENENISVKENEQLVDQTSQESDQMVAGGRHEEKSDDADTENHKVKDGKTQELDDNAKVEDGQNMEYEDGFQQLGNNKHTEVHEVDSNVQPTNTELSDGGALSITFPKDTATEDETTDAFDVKVGKAVDSDNEKVPCITEGTTPNQAMEDMGSPGFLEINEGKGNPEGNTQEEGTYGTHGESNLINIPNGTSAASETRCFSSGSDEEINVDAPPHPTVDTPTETDKVAKQMEMETHNDDNHSPKDTKGEESFQEKGLLDLDGAGADGSPTADENAIGTEQKESEAEGSAERSVEPQSSQREINEHEEVESPEFNGSEKSVEDNTTYGHEQSTDKFDNENEETDEKVEDLTRDGETLAPEQEDNQMTTNGMDSIANKNEEVENGESSATDDIGLSAEDNHTYDQEQPASILASNGGETDEKVADLTTDGEAVAIEREANEAEAGVMDSALERDSELRSRQLEVGGHDEVVYYESSRTDETEKFFGDQDICDREHSIEVDKDEDFIVLPDEHAPHEGEPNVEQVVEQDTPKESATKELFGHGEGELKPTMGGSLNNEPDTDVTSKRATREKQLKSSDRDSSELPPTPANTIINEGDAFILAAGESKPKKLELEIKTRKKKEKGKETSEKPLKVMPLEPAVSQVKVRKSTSLFAMKSAKMPDEFVLTTAALQPEKEKKEERLKKTTSTKTPPSKRNRSPEKKATKSNAGKPPVSSPVIKRSTSRGKPKKTPEKHHSPVALLTEGEKVTRKKEADAAYQCWLARKNSERRDRSLGKRTQQPSLDETGSPRRERSPTKPKKQ